MKKPVKGNAFHKLNIAVLITCVAFLCTGLCINKYYKTVLEERLMEDIDVRVVKWKDSFDRQLDNLQMAQSNLLYSQGVAKINMYWDYRSSYERMTDCVSLSDKLKEIRILYTLIDKIGIYFPQHHKVVSGNAPILESYEEDEFYDNRLCLLSDSGDLLLTTYYPLAISGKENKCVYYIRSVITASRLKTFLEQNIQIDETGFAAVADQSGKLVVVYRDKTTPQEENWENRISYELTEALKYNDNVDALRIKSDIMISGSYSKKSGLWILYGYPKNAIQDPLKKTVVMDVIMILLVLILYFAFRSYATHIIAHPLNRIMEAMAKQKMPPLLNMNENDEFAQIYEQYNQMIMDTNRLMKEKMDAEYQSKLSQLRQLQYQIQPHFLYNSLFTISRMAQLDDNDEIAEYAKHLGKYYQYITKSSDREVTFNQELEQVKDYLYIQNIRFEDRIEIIMDEMPESIMQIKIAHMILQPLAENAYQHGLKNIASGGIIHISAGYENGYLWFQVEDNGDGISPKQLSELKQRLERGEINKEEIHGLTNVQARISLLYGSESGLTVNSGTEGGFCVRMKIAVLKNG